MGPVRLGLLTAAVNSKGPMVIGGGCVELETVVLVIVFCSLAVFGVAYGLSPHLRRVMRARVRGNFGNAAGVDVGVGGTVFMSVAAIAAEVGITLDPKSLATRMLFAFMLLALAIALSLVGISLYAFLYGGPKWAVRDSRDLWVAEARKAMRENRKSKDARGARRLVRDCDNQHLAFPLAEARRTTDDPGTAGQPPTEQAAPSTGSNHEHRRDRLMSRRDKPINGVDEMLAEIDRKLSDGTMSLAEHDDWQRKLLELKRPVQWELAWPISLGITIGLILLAVLVIYLVNQP